MKPHTWVAIACVALGALIIWQRRPSAAMAAQCQPLEWASQTTGRVH